MNEEVDNIADTLHDDLSVGLLSRRPLFSPYGFLSDTACARQDQAVPREEGKSESDSESDSTSEIFQPSAFLSTEQASSVRSKCPQIISTVTGDTTKPQPPPETSTLASGSSSADEWYKRASAPGAP